MSSATLSTSPPAATGFRLPVPAARGPLSEQVLATVTAGGPGTAVLPSAARIDPTSDLVADEDVQLTLFCLQELHYRGLEGVDDAWEWDVSAIALRRALEDAFEAHLRGRVTVPDLVATTADDVARALFGMTASSGGPSLARFVARKASLAQLREVLVHKSVYQLKEADPHTWAIPRLTGRAKAAAVEIQADEYGGGHLASMHSELFRRTLRALDLDDRYGTYVDAVPAVTLATSTFMSLAGLNRRLRGAITGHLAAFEMTSSIPSRQYADGMRRLGLGEDATGYFDEHVEADAVHEQIAGRDLAGGLVEAEPHLLGDVLFGAGACLLLDDLAAARHLAAFDAGTSSLRKVAA